MANESEKQDEQKKKKPRFFRQQTAWLQILFFGIGFVIIVILLGQTQTSDRVRIDYNVFKRQLQRSNIDAIHSRGKVIKGTFRRPFTPEKKGAEERAYTRFRTTMPEWPDTELQKLLDQKKVAQSAESDEESWQSLVFFQLLLPILLLVGLWFFLANRMRGQESGLFSIGKSKAKRHKPRPSDVTFEDVAGLDQAKQELQEIILFLKDPKRFRRLGAKSPKGLLLVGPPGTGKTLLAKAVAGESGVPFFAISGSEFMELFVGVGASRVRDLFKNAKRHSPAIIFIDEIDAVGRARGTGVGGGHDEREQTLNQLLSEMDGFESNDAVVVIAATNRPDVLDSALLRPGRFDRQIVVEKLPREGRRKILEVHARKTTLADDVDLDLVARQTPGFSGAMLENLVNEAAIFATRKNKDQVDMSDFEQARDKIIMGAVRDEGLTEADRRVTAVHESGHALVARLLPNTDPVHKVSIIPRGRALGVMMQLPEEDRYNYSRSYLLDKIAVLLAGRAAETVVLDELSVGAADDVKKATTLARRMVTQWGMSETIGPIHYATDEEHTFLGRDISRQRDFSEDTQRRIDEEIEKLVGGCAERAQSLIEENREKLNRLVEGLLEKEVIEIDELDRLLELDTEEVPHPPKDKAGIPPEERHIVES